MKKLLILFVCMFIFMGFARANTGAVEHANTIIGYKMMKSDYNRSDPENRKIQEILSFEIAWHCEQLGFIASLSPKYCDMVVRNWNTILGSY